MKNSLDGIVMMRRLQSRQYLSQRSWHTYRREVTGVPTFHNFRALSVEELGSLIEQTAGK